MLPYNLCSLSGCKKYSLMIIYTLSFEMGVQFFTLQSPLSKIGHIPQIPHIAESQSLSVSTSKAKYPSYSFSVRYLNSFSVKRGAEGCNRAEVSTAEVVFPGGSPFLMCYLISKSISSETSILLLILKIPEGVYNNNNNAY